jgi:glutaredoxin
MHRTPRTLATALLCAMLVALSATTASAQYRWIDANGKVNFGDTPPRDAKEVKPIGNRAASAPPGADSQSSLPFELRRAVERAPVVLYTAPECPPCAPAVALLRERGIPYSERVVVTQADLREFERLSGGLRLPHLTVGGQARNGFNPDLWTALLDAAGYPKGSMLPRSYQWPAPQPIVPPVKPEAEAADANAAPQAVAPVRTR